MKIEFSTSNLAFSGYADGYDDLVAATEIERILKRIANEVIIGKRYGSIMDINGNKIGEWSL